jgi:hypothetical protein
LPRVRARVAAPPANVALAATLPGRSIRCTSEVVDYITQRTESMMAFFALLTLYAALRAHDAARRRWTALAVLACLAGTVCKETIAVVPLLVVLHDRVFVFESWRGAVRNRGRLYLGLAASWLVLAGLVSSGPRAAVSGPTPAGHYLLNQAVIGLPASRRGRRPVVSQLAGDAVAGRRPPQAGGRAARSPARPWSSAGRRYRRSFVTLPT